MRSSGRASTGPLGNWARGERLILGMSDRVPPNADLGRLERIKARVDAFEPLSPGRRSGG